MNWFKFYGQDFLTDPKIKSLSAIDQLAFVYLLSLGSQSNGVIEIVTEKILAGMMCAEFDNLKGVFERLSLLKMIRHDNGRIVIINFEKRQQSNLTGYERVKRYRENKAKLLKPVINDNVGDNKDDNDRIDKIREEEIRIEQEEVAAPQKKINSLSLTKGQVMAFMKSFPGMTCEEVKEEAKKCSQYMAMSSNEYTNPGLFFRGWMKKVYPEWKKKKSEEERERQFQSSHATLTPEQIEANRVRIAEIKSKFPVKTL